MSTRTIKKLLLSVIAVGLIASVTAGSTYALFTSKTTNANNTIQSGTLTFSNTVNTGTACVTQSSTGNVNTGCDALVTAASTWFPLSSNSPASTEYAAAKLTITDSGSLPASALSVYMPSCSPSATTGAPSPGGGNPCASGGLDFQIEEMTDATFTTPLKCWWPTVAAGACSFNDANLVNSLANFDGTYNVGTNRYPLGTGPAAMSSRYFLIVLAEPVNASNALQGETATLALQWHMDS